MVGGDCDAVLYRCSGVVGFSCMFGLFCGRPVAGLVVWQIKETKPTAIPAVGLFFIYELLRNCEET